MAKILVVDDNDTIRSLARTTLELLGGHEVLEASNGREALGQLNGGPCDLILTDLDMPVMTGPELIGQIRASEIHSGMPIIVLTALSDERKRQQLLGEYAIEHFLIKPFDPQALHDLVEGVLGG